MTEKLGIYKSQCIVGVGDEIFNFNFGYKKHTDGLFEITIDERPEDPFSKSIHILKDRKQKEGVEIICAGESEQQCNTEEGAVKVAGWWAMSLVRLMKLDKDFNDEWVPDEDKIEIMRHVKLF